MFKASNAARHLFRQNSRVSQIARMVLGAAASIGLGWLVLKGMDWQKVAEAYRGFPISMGLLGVLAFFASISLRAFRWRLLFIKEKVTFSQLFLVQNAGIGLNNLLPVRVLSEPVQVALLVRRYGVNTATAIATLITEHLMDIIANAVLLGIGVLLFEQLRGYSIQLAGAAILGVVSVMALLLFARGARRVPIVGRFAVVRRFADAVAILQKSRLRLLGSLVTTFGQWVCLGLSGWFVAQGLGMSLSLATMIVLFLAAVFFTSAAPSLPGAVGTFDFAVIQTLDLFGIDKTTAIAFALVMHVILFLPSTVIALLVLPREGVRSLTSGQPAVGKLSQ